jgi:hypothetical protein
MSDRLRPRAPTRAERENEIAKSGRKVRDPWAGAMLEVEHLHNAFNGNSQISPSSFTGRNSQLLGSVVGVLMFLFGLVSEQITMLMCRDNIKADDQP